MSPCRGSLDRLARANVRKSAPVQGSRNHPRDPRAATSGARLLLLAVALITTPTLAHAYPTKAWAKNRGYSYLVANKAYSEAYVKGSPDQFDDEYRHSRGVPAPSITTTAVAGTSSWPGYARASMTSYRRKMVFSSQVGGVAAGSSFRTGVGPVAVADGVPVSAHIEDFQVQTGFLGATTMTLDLSGSLRLPGSSPASARGDTVYVGVYPDSMLAIADSTGLGLGAVFFGRVMVSEPGVGLATAGAFTPAHFVVQGQNTDSLRVSCAPGLHFVIPGIDSSRVAVSLIGSADATAPPEVPGLSPWTLVLILVPLAWFGARRQRRKVWSQQQLVD